MSDLEDMEKRLAEALVAAPKCLSDWEAFSRKYGVNPGTVIEEAATILLRLIRELPGEAVELHLQELDTQMAKRKHSAAIAHNALRARIVEIITKGRE